MKSDLSPLLFDDAFSQMDARDELTVAVLRGARAMAIALQDRNEASDTVAAAEAGERLELTLRLTTEMIRLHDAEVARGVS